MLKVNGAECIDYFFPKTSIIQFLFNLREWLTLSEGEVLSGE